MSTDAERNAATAKKKSIMDWLDGEVLGGLVKCFFVGCSRGKTSRRVVVEHCRRTINMLHAAGEVSVITSQPAMIIYPKIETSQGIFALAGQQPFSWNGKEGHDWSGGVA